MALLELKKALIDARKTFVLFTLPPTTLLPVEITLTVLAPAAWYEAL
jgi:hypothetical protein